MVRATVSGVKDHLGGVTTSPGMELDGALTWSAAGRLMGSVVRFIDSRRSIEFVILHKV